MTLNELIRDLTDLIEKDRLSGDLPVRVDDPYSDDPEDHWEIEAVCWAAVNPTEVALYIGERITDEGD